MSDRTMPAAASRQTISYLGKRFAEAGLRPSSRHGQHFLVDQNLLRLIVERAELERRDVVLEVGTGTGALAALISPCVASLVTVEIDAQLAQLAAEELRGQENVVMLRADALRNKSNLNPQVIATVVAQRAAVPQARFKLVANLPYNVATPLIANLLLSPIVPATMTVTVQKEVADRIVARPGTKDYGALAVWLQSQCHTELVRTLPPSVFWPRPKVNSAIVHLELDPLRRERIGDLRVFHDFVRALFLHRRKFLRSVMVSAFKNRLDKPAVDALLEGCGLRADCRAEQLDVPAILKLCETAERAVGAERAS